ncbi:hypothetical protein JCM19238_3512 [Vibrio ponticus]|nr:hypothetical protein JCM19238_3512 [Vibrio ponticus]
MRTAIVIALSLLSFSAFGVHATNQQDDADNHDKPAKAEVTTEQTIKAIATGAIAIGMSPKQIEHAAKSMK